MGIINILILSGPWLIWIISTINTKNQIKGFNQFLTTSAFLLPFFGLSFLLFGFQISFIKLTPLFILFLYLFQNNWKFPKDIKNFFFYLIGLTIISYLICILNGNFTNVIQNYNRPTLNAYVNPFVQSIFFLTSISQIWLIDKKSIINSISVLKAYIYGSYFLTIFGYLIFFLNRINIIVFKYHFIGYQINYDETNIGEQAALYRMNSLGGEPKHFAAIISLSIFLQLYLRSKELKLKYITDKVGDLFLVLAIVSLFWSYSANIIPIFLISILFYFFRNNKKLFIKIIVLILATLALVINFEIKGFIEMFNKISSLEMINYALPRENFAIRAIFDNFFSFFFGNGIGMMDLYHIKYYIYQKNIVYGIIDRSQDVIDNIIQPSLNISLLLGNGGIIGFYLITHALKKRIKSIYDKKAKTIIYTISLFMLFTGNVSLTIGMFLLSIIINEENKNMKKLKINTDI